MDKLEVEKEYKVEYPFCKTIWEEHYEYDTGAYDEIDCWRPGIHKPNSDLLPIDIFEESINPIKNPLEVSCDGIGEMILEVISIHKPGKFPTRVFYTRKWKDPDGKVFGKNKLRISTLGNFKRMLKGYRYKYKISN